MPKGVTSALGAEIQNLWSILRLCHTLGTDWQKYSSCWLYKFMHLWEAGHGFSSTGYICWILKISFLDLFIFNISFLVYFFPEQVSIKVVFPFLQSHCFCDSLDEKVVRQNANTSKPSILQPPPESRVARRTKTAYFSGQMLSLPLQISGIDP